MDFKIPSDTKTPASTRRSPPNYFSRSVKLRLGTLVAALGLVFLMMNEARKPATWERLGFSSTQSNVNSASKTFDPTYDLSDQSFPKIPIGDADKELYDQVEDRTSMNRSVESAAWNRTWQRILDASNQSFEPVSLIQLSGQPEAYRGQFIQLVGSVRGIETIVLPDDHELGFGSYNVLWIKPATSNQTPFCVYTKQLPSKFPKPKSGFLKLKEDVSVNGIFFKLRSYLATNGNVEICPLVVAETVLWRPTVKQTRKKKWSPPGWVFTLFFVGMPLIAAVLAWKVYQSTQSISFRKRGGNAEAQINQTLEELASCDEVKSDQQRVMELYDSELTSNNDENQAH